MAQGAQHGGHLVDCQFEPVRNGNLRCHKSVTNPDEPDQDIVLDGGIALIVSAVIENLPGNGNLQGGQPGIEQGFHASQTKGTQNKTFGGFNGIGSGGGFFNGARQMTQLRRC